MNEKDLLLVKQNCFKNNNNVNGRCNNQLWWAKRNLLDVYHSILKFTNFLPTTSNMNVRIYHVINNISNIPECAFEQCCQLVKWQTSTNAYSKYCSKKCNALANRKFKHYNTFSTPATKEKIKNTNLEKYAVQNFSKTEQFKGFMKNFHSAMPQEKIDAITKKRIGTNLQRYGVVAPLLNENILSKSKLTLLKNHSVQHPLQSTEILEKAKSTNIQRYNVPSYNQSHIDPEFLSKISDKEWVLEKLKFNSVKQIALINNVSYSHLCKKIKEAGIDLTNYSYLEKEIGDFLLTLVKIEDIEYKNRTILEGKEIDIYLPKYNIGIECNGVYWHSENKGKNRNYHLNKTNLAQQKNVRLVHIFENEWILKPDIVKSRLRTLLGKNEKKYARKLNLIPVFSKIEKEFLMTNHLQGHVRSSICYGLVDENNKLYCLMSFGKSRYNKKYQWELLRYASLNNHSVIGAASKLFAHFVKLNRPNSVISYCDLRWFTGQMYEKLKFEFSHYSSPNYYYLEPNGTLSSRIKYQKHKMKNILPIFDFKLSEWENMKNNGYDRIWDCGNSVWLWGTNLKFRVGDK